MEQCRALSLCFCFLCRCFHTNLPPNNRLLVVVPLSYCWTKRNKEYLTGSVLQPDTGVLNDRKQIATWGAVCGTSRETSSTGVSPPKAESHLPRFRHPSYLCIKHMTQTTHPVRLEFVMWHRPNSSVRNWQTVKVWLFEQTNMSVWFWNPFFQIITRQRKGKTTRLGDCHVCCGFAWETQVSFVG